MGSQRVGPSKAGSEDRQWTKQPVLCVDMDGTLVKEDTMLLAVKHMVWSQPYYLVPLMLRLLGGRARAKKFLAEKIPLDAEAVSYRPSLVGFLRRESLAGRRIVLATASDASYAGAVASKLGVFNEVVASDGVVNLKGVLKRRELVRRYGEFGYDYIGNGASDFAVWDKARRVVVVGASRRLRQRARARFGERVVLWKEDSNESAVEHCWGR